MIAVLKITAGAAAMCAVFAVVAAGTGWIAFEAFGAFTLIFVYCLAIILAFVGYAGYATGTIASAIEARHPVSHAVLSALVLCIGIGAGVHASPLSIDWQELTWLSAGMIAIAAWQAHRLRRRSGASP